MIRIILTCSLLLASTASVMAQQPLRLSQQDCRERAIAHSEDLQQANNAIQQAKLDRKIANTAYLPNLEGSATGAYVLEVVEGGSADRAGIQVKDIIIDLGGNTVSNVTELTRALRKFQAGDTTTVTVIRSGKEITLDITLDEKPQELPEETQPAPDDGGYSSDPFSDWFSWYFGS